MVDFSPVFFVGIFASDCTHCVHEAVAIILDEDVTNGRHPLAKPFSASSIWKILLLHSLQCVPGSHIVWDRVLVAARVQRASQLKELIREQCCHSVWQQAAPCCSILHHLRCPSVSSCLLQSFFYNNGNIGYAGKFAIARNEMVKRNCL